MKMPPLSEVSARYGAPMGRDNTFPDDVSAQILLVMRPLRWIDGDYDQGGAYWGQSDRRERIWRACGESPGHMVEVFVRAPDSEAARRKVRDKLPRAVFQHPRWMVRLAGRLRGDPNAVKILRRAKPTIDLLTWLMQAGAPENLKPQEVSDFLDAYRHPVKTAKR